MSALVETMAHFGATPWHQNSTLVNEEDIREWRVFCKKAGMDTTVESCPLYARVPRFRGEGGDTDGRKVEHDLIKIESHRANVRNTDSKVLGIVSREYTIIQNQQLFEWFDPFVKEGLAAYHTAGVLREGAHVWVLCQIGNPTEIVKNDDLATFLLLSSGHDGTRSCWVLPTMVRVVCANTEHVAMQRGRDIRIKIQHSGDGIQKLEDLQKRVRPTLNSFSAMKDLFKMLSRREADQRMVKEFLKEVMPLPDRSKTTERKIANVESKRDRIVEIFEADLIGGSLLQPEDRRTAWTLFNSFTQWMDWERSKKKETGLRSNWFGQGVQIKQKALETVRVLAGIGGRDG